MRPPWHFCVRRAWLDKAGPGSRLFTGGGICFPAGCIASTKEKVRSIYEYYEIAMITIAGRPNVGKSTLTNALVGEKIAIVSNKPQTTRNRICAVVNRDDVQIVFMDTPGFHKARNKLGTYMDNVVHESIADVDAIMLLVEPIPSVGTQEKMLLEQIRESKIPAVLVINKIDALERKEDLFPVIAAYSAEYEFASIIPISAQKRQGIDELFAEVSKFAAPGPQLFPDGMVTDQPERQVMAEIIRKSSCGVWTGRSPRHGGGDLTSSPSGRTAASSIWRPQFTAKKPATRALLSANRERC